MLARITYCDQIVGNTVEPIDSLVRCLNAHLYRDRAGVANVSNADSDRSIQTWVPRSALGRN